ncbi:MAG: DUF2232 domain-containing protein [Rhizobiales bacterium]|nr:DUF2232 domain-containing protein [Hyphomicrobiales bacterium]
MAYIALIGLGAGAASAMLFASVASGSLISILLFYLAPLPILIAALGWSHWAALIAALAAAAGLTAALGGYFFFAFLFGVGLPAWWLGYLALLARSGPTGDLDWYPLGRIVLWAAIFGTLVVVAAIPTLGPDEETFRATLRNGFERIVRAQGQTPAPPPRSGDAETTGRLIDFLVGVIPPAAAVLSTVINLIDLWLAGRIVRLSGRLSRPWPDLAEIRLPPITPLLLAAGVVGCFVPGLLGIMAGVFVATLLVIYAMTGLAVLHFITRGMTSRGLLLGGTYTALLVFGWPVLLMTLFGLVDAAVDLRNRTARRGGPPSSPIT